MATYLDEGQEEVVKVLKNYVVMENIKEYKRLPTLRSLAYSKLDTETTSKINENKLFQPGKLGGKRKTRKSTNKKKNKKTRSKKQKGGDPPMTIHQAVKAGLVEKVKEMIDNGRDVNQPLSNGITPLMVATHELRNGRRTRGAMRMVDMLLEKGADVNKVTALDLNVLHFAAATNNVHLIRKFIEKGADKNKTSNEGSGETPLNIAVRNGNMDAIKALIDGGVDINHVNDNGETAVFLVSRGFIFPLSPLLSAKILKLLIDSGANIQIENNDHLSPLWIATLNGNLNLVKLLLEGGADVESFDEDGYTPLAIGAENGRLRSIKLILKAGADIEAQDNEGNTPLMMAANNGHEDIVEFFLKKDAYVNHENDEGLTAVDLAQREGHLEIVAMLRKHNINNEIRGYKRPNMSSLGTLAYQQEPSVVDQLFNDPKRGIKRPFSQLGGKRKTRKSTNKKKNKKTGSKKKKGGRDGSINHKYNVIEKYKTEVDSENTNPFPYYNYYNNTIHELLEHENSLRRNNRAANIIRENTTEFRIIYMTLHVFLRSNTFVNGLVNENKIDDVILNIKLLIPLINESEKKRMFEFLNQKDYNIGLKLYSIRDENNRLEFPNIVKEKLDEYKNEFISTIGV
jgi:ankyrin repeat protein